MLNNNSLDYDYVINQKTSVDIWMYSNFIVLKLHIFEIRKS